MVNQAIWIGITVGVFFAGLGIGYSIIQQTAVTPTMSFQQMQQMMQNPQLMKQWMSSPEHAQQMADIMREDHDFMMGMYSEMMNDEQLRLQMMGHMTEYPEMMQQMGHMMGNRTGMMHP